MDFKTIKKQVDWWAAGSLLLGASVFFYLYSELLNTSYIGWLMNIGGDPFQHYVGWELFRSSPWSFPLGRIANLAYPVGVPVIFTDSIPLLAIFFKLWRQWLPFPFQYVGIWQLLCMALQGFFGYLLLKQYSQRRWLAFFGSLFFILSPIMLFRLEGHFSLGAHWLLLWSLWLTLRTTGSIRIKHWTAILILATLIHSYLFLMCVVLFLADLVRRIHVIKTVYWKKGYCFLAAEMVLTLLVSFSIGNFSVGNSAAPGFGIYSLDLNSLINPDGWSSLLAGLPVRHPNEGFNYLGLGIIFLGCLALFKYLCTVPTWISVRKTIVGFWPLVLVAVIFTAIAVSNMVTINGRELFRFHLPQFWIEQVFGVVRSSGRLFWPVYYLFVLGSFFVFKKMRPVFVGLLLIGALGLQTYDLHHRLKEMDYFYQGQHWQSPLQSSFWQEAAKKYEHISLQPTFIYGKHDVITLFAAQHGLTLNTGLIVRNAALVNKNEMEAQARDLAAGVIDQKTLYVFRNENEARQLTKQVDLTRHPLIIVDGFAVLAP